MDFKNLDRVPFNWPSTVGSEVEYIQKAIDSRHIAGDGEFSVIAEKALEAITGSVRVKLTHSCTAALEMAALLLRISAGDEIIVPSYTFVSSVNAFVIHGATPVFVDVGKTNFNIDINLVEAAITPRTKAVVAVNYGGASCDLSRLRELCDRYGIYLVEDAAQSIGAYYNGRPLGSFGHLAAFSFHETKNVSCGEGGCLIINDSVFVERAEIIREKGTNRAAFLSGRVDKYTWHDVGSSYLPSDILAAYLVAQLEEIDSIMTRRRRIWSSYQSELADLALDNNVLMNQSDLSDSVNGHLSYLVFKNSTDRGEFIHHCATRNIQVVPHYVALHNSPMAKKCNWLTEGDLHNTELASNGLVRLPLFYRMTDIMVDRVIECCLEFFKT